MSDSDPDRTVKKIRQLYRLRNKLSTMNMAPNNVWIQQYTVPRYYPKSDTTYYYTYAKWEASEPIFECRPKGYSLKHLIDQNLNCDRPKKYTKHQHIGRVCSSSGLEMDWEVKVAYRGLRNRRWLNRVESALARIESAINDF